MVYGVGISFCFMIGFKIFVSIFLLNENGFFFSIFRTTTGSFSIMKILGSNVNLNILLYF